MDDQSGYFALIDELVASFPPDAGRIGEVLGLTLHRQPEASSPLEEVWEAVPADGGPFRNVMLRLPGPLADAPRAMLSLQLGQSREVTRDGIVARLGPDYAFSPPSPRYVRGTVPAYMRYDRPWGRLAFGVSTDPQADLQEIELHVDIPPPAPPANEDAADA